MQEADRLGLQPTATCCVSFGMLFYCLISGDCIILCYIVLCYNLLGVTVKVNEIVHVRFLAGFPAYCQHQETIYIYWLYKLPELRDFCLFCPLLCHNSILLEMLLVTHLSQDFFARGIHSIKQAVNFFHPNFLSAYSSDYMMPAGYVYVHLFPLRTSGKGNDEITMRKLWLLLLYLCHLGQTNFTFLHLSILSYKMEIISPFLPTSQGYQESPIRYTVLTI